MPRITKRLVETARAEAADTWLWDSELRGFGVRVRPSGVRSYVVQYRNAHGRSRRLTIGVHGRLTADEARREARLILAAVDRGGDPAEARQQGRKTPIVADLAERYLADHSAVKMKPRSAAEDRRLIERHVLPALGARRVADLARADVARVHHALRATPVQANRVASLLSRMLRPG